MIRSLLYIVVGVFLTVACKTSPPQKTDTPSEPDRPVSKSKPSWLLQKPQSSSYYQGIGNASMSDPDYQQTARNEALDDLSAEISVNISSTSLLYQLDIGDRFREEYQNAIKAEVNQLVEGHELVDSWQDGQMYWTFYRLSKAEHQRRIDEKKNTALEKGLDFYDKALTSLDNKNYTLAISYFTQTLAAIENYLGENTTITYKGQSILLANEAYSGLKNTLNGIRFHGPDKVTVRQRSENSENLTIEARFNDDNKVTGFPAIVTGAVSGRNGLRKTTDTKGHFLIAQREMVTESKSLHIEANLRKLNSTRSKLIEAIIDKLPAPKKEILIEAKTLTMFIESDENNLGKTLNRTVINGMLVGALSQKGIVFAENKAEADLIIKISSDTRKGSELSGLFTTFLDVDVNIIDNNTNKELYADAIYDLKGIQLSYEKAGLKAYQDARERIEKELAPEILKNLY
ncbi:LPP20 family lipoprotein [Fulvivirga sp. M361]|uniref:LPP20 family lipoprotein n=1 Tax=Fulvivirga sp. M361 TaxID=2594266 RepID=UPI00117A8F63|nr:LPP20 family lipoprotein [Fulvivirga sp. M361]